MFASVPIGCVLNSRVYLYEGIRPVRPDWGRGRELKRAEESWLIRWITLTQAQPSCVNSSVLHQQCHACRTHNELASMQADGSCTCGRALVGSGKCWVCMPRPVSRDKVREPAYEMQTSSDARVNGSALDLKDLITFTTFPCLHRSRLVVAKDRFGCRVPFELPPQSCGDGTQVANGHGLHMTKWV